MKVELNVDLGRPDGDIRRLNGVNMGPLMMNGWLDFSETYKELAFPLTRLHDCPYAVPEVVDVHCIFPLFHADPQDPRNYRFRMTDDYIQSVLDTGSQIVYRLGESIEHYTRGHYHIQPPEDYDKWAEICVNIIRHYNQGWADGFHHDIRYWEIWNEPSKQPGATWGGTDEEYFRLYEVASKAIKAFDPTLKVGGPALPCAHSAIDFGRQFLEYCRKTESPLDFYSWHLYARDPRELVNGCKDARDGLDEAGFRDAEIHLNEWSYLPTEGWKFNSRRKDPDCVQRADDELGGSTGAAFVAATLVYLQDCPVDVVNHYWMRTDLWGILSQWGHKRKSYYAFKAFRNMLDTPNRVKTTPNDPATGYALLAGTGKKNEAGIMLANFRAREESFSINIEGWPWKGEAVCRRYLLDDARDLTLAEESILEKECGCVDFVMPAPGFCHITVTPPNTVSGATC